MSLQIDSYEITELDNDKPYIKMRDSLTVYVKKAKINNEYKATGVSFVKSKWNSSSRSINVTLENGVTVRKPARTGTHSLSGALAFTLFLKATLYSRRHFFL